MTEYAEKRHEDLAILEAIMHTHPAYAAKAARSQVEMFSKYAPSIFIDSLLEACGMMDFTAMHKEMFENITPEDRKMHRTVFAQGARALTKQLKKIERYMERAIP